MKNILVFLIAICLFSACDNDNFEDAFDKTPNERLQEKITEYSTALKSSEYGWKLPYYINDQVMGALHFMMQFKENNLVDMRFELSDNTIESTYKVNAQEEIILSFDTYNFLSVLSDPKTTEDYQSFGGEFEFAIRSANTDSIVMLSKKNRRRVVLYKAEKYDWENKFADIKKMQTELLDADMPVVTGDNYLIRKIKFNSGLSASETVDIVYNKGARRLKIAHKNKDGEIQVYNKSIEFLNTGFKLHTPLQINDISLKEFVFNDATKLFESKEKTCSIDYEKNAEALIGNTANLWEHTWHFTKDWETSAALKPYVDEVVKVINDDANDGIFLFLHNNALIKWSFRYPSPVAGVRWADFNLRQLFIDDLSNICFLMRDEEELKYDHDDEMSVKLYENKTTREFIELLHDEKGWLVIELEKEKRYRFISKKDSKYWFVVEEGYVIK
ncbi:MAG: DUF4302 domain-containing protein [Marinifilaceae bacterium]|jgi:hypothetical protein|nr:DUF4302 domain-containing protein [Marinifilaceae bacterium]